MNSISFYTLFLLGALHSLEPGHGKSIVALQTSKSGKWTDALLLLVTILISHFTFVGFIAWLLYKYGDIVDLKSITIIAPIALICYGIFLLIKSKKHKNQYLGCNCSAHSESTVKSSLIAGIIAGITPCPSVFAPIALSISSQSVNEVLSYVLFYIMGVVSVYIVLVIIVLLLGKSSNDKFKTLSSKVNSHLFSGIILIVIGLVYLVRFVMH